MVGRCRDLAIILQRTGPAVNEQVHLDSRKNSAAIYMYGHPGEVAEEAERLLSAAVAELNGLANSSGKGRSDLDVEASGRLPWR